MLKLSSEIFKRYIAGMNSFVSNEKEIERLRHGIITNNILLKLNARYEQYIRQMDDNSAINGIAHMLRLSEWFSIQPKREVTLFTHRIIDKAVLAFDLINPNIVTCKKSCSFCCYQQILITKSEGDLLSDVIKENPLVVNMDRLELHRTWKQVDSWNYPLEMKRCPFLSDQNLCSIYEYRPLVCRTHRSADVPSKCNESLGIQSIRLVNQFDTALISNAVAIAFDVKPMAHQVVA